MSDDVLVVRIPSLDERLGRHIRHDPASKAYAFAAPEAAVPVSVRHKRYIDILDQLRLGSCTGNAGVGCLGTGAFFQTLISVISDWSENTAIQLYSDATKIDGDPLNYPPNDTGSDGLSIAKVLKQRGWISGYRHAFSFDDLLAALSAGPVITGVNWYSSFFTPDANGIISIPANATIAGGHEFVLDEIDMERKLIGASNSWGTKWGVSGRFYIPFDLMKRLLSEQGDVTVFTPNTAPAPTPGPTPVPPTPPTPDPGPVVSPVSDDQKLWNDTKAWANARHHGATKAVATALKDWAAKSNLD